MRRGSAVLLSILPLLAPTYALPTYMGNEATVAHMNVERAAVPEAAINNLEFADVDEAAPVPAHAASTTAFGNIASEGSDHWLLPKRREKRQAPSSDTISLEDSSSAEGATEAPAQASVAPRRKGFIENIGSYGPKMWLGTAKREIEERSAAPEAKPIVTLDFNYKPPPINQLAPNPTA